MRYMIFAITLALTGPAFAQSNGSLIIRDFARDIGEKIEQLENRVARLESRGGDTVATEDLQLQFEALKDVVAEEVEAMRALQPRFEAGLRSISSERARSERAREQLAESLEGESRVVSRSQVSPSGATSSRDNRPWPVPESALAISANGNVRSLIDLPRPPGPYLLVIDTKPGDGRDQVYWRLAEQNLGPVWVDEMAPESRPALAVGRFDDTESAIQRASAINRATGLLPRIKTLP
ncbi:MAG: hypothetical protein RJQ08_11370 [Salinisphaeraceae bacterium]